MSENGLHKIPAMRAALVAIQELHKPQWSELFQRDLCDVCGCKIPCPTRKLADEGLADRMARTNQGETQ